MPQGTLRLTIEGHCPSKKTAKRAWRGRVVTDPDKQRRIAQMIWQAQSQWKRAPLERATVSFVFAVRNGKGDLDGKLTTVLDILVRAGVIRNDTIARVPELRAVAIVDKRARESVTIDLTPLARERD